MSVEDNIQDVINNLERGGKEIEQAIAESILERAVEIVPVQSGELRDSGHVDEDANVVFDADHAVVVHETQGDGYKFLIRASSEIDGQQLAEQIMENL